MHTPSIREVVSYQRRCGAPRPGHLPDNLTIAPESFGQYAQDMLGEMRVVISREECVYIDHRFTCHVIARLLRGASFVSK